VRGHPSSRPPWHQSSAARLEGGSLPWGYVSNALSREGLTEEPEGWEWGFVQVAGGKTSELDNDVPKATCLSTESSDPQKAPVLTLASESREQTATLGERTFNCCYPGCHFKTVHGMKDLDRHLRIHT
uniref:ZFP64 zinc finger protein n=1 Tax=Saimiri boliviensis boliviensis TaxID=39432 RepID=A0A2K6TKE9_SAIBB